MLDISSQAIQQLKEFKERRGPGSSVRIGIVSGQASGPNLGVTIDSATDNDTIFAFDTLEVVIDKGLLEYCKAISVAYVLDEKGGCGSGGGFKITAENPL